MSDPDLVWEAEEPPMDPAEEEMFPDDDDYDDTEWGQDEPDWWTEQRYLGDED
jgi:hypothetical protein